MPNNSYGSGGTRPGRGKRQYHPNRVKLLMSILNIGDEDTFNETINDFSVSLSFSCVGRGTAHGAILSYLGIGDTDKSVMASLIPESDEEDILEAIRDRMDLHRVGGGISFTVPLCSVSELVQRDIRGAAKEKSVDGRKIMRDKDRKYELIIAMVAAGFADEAMAAARRAGAAGGTILDARSVNNAKAEQFLGIQLHDESEIILILSQRTVTDTISDALMEWAGLKTDARGVIFTLPVDRTVGIGSIAETPKEDPAHPAEAPADETGDGPAEKAEDGPNPAGDGTREE